MIVDLLRENPDGLTIHEIRSKLPEDIGPQEQLDRRIRDLRARYDIPWVNGKYLFRGERVTPTDSSAISGRLRTAVLHKAHGRCQMCGKTIAEDEIKLEVDHKIPRNWGGDNTEENLWALCQGCNNGKRDFFASLDEEEMTELVSLKTVYERIATLLHRHEGQPVPSWFLEFVANFDDFQEDWQKRLRELRYPVIGMKIKSTRTKTPSGKWQAAYSLEHWEPLPANHQFLIKDHERKNRERRRKRLRPLKT